MTGLVVVTVPATSTRLTTLDLARLEVGADDTSDDLVLGKLIDRASSVIAGHTGRVFGVETVVETFRIAGAPALRLTPAGQALVGQTGSLVERRRPLLLSRDPVTTVASITEDGTALDPAADFEVDTKAAIVYRLRDGRRGLWCGSTIVVTYSAGYVLPNDAGTVTLPAAVGDVCLALVRSADALRGRDPNVAMDMLDGDRVQYWDRSIGGMTLDDGLKAELARFVVRGW